MLTGRWCQAPSTTLFTHHTLAGTDPELFRPKQLTGKEAEAILGSANITCNKNGIPNDPQKPMVTSGIRLGSPAMTTRGFGVQEAAITANLIADVLDRPRDEENLARVRAEVKALTRRFPVYGRAAL